MKTKIRLIILVAAVGILVYSGFQLITIQKTYQKGDEIYDEIEKQVFHIDESKLKEEEDLSAVGENENGKNESKGKTEKLPDFSLDFNQMREMNKDMKGWIYIPGTKVSYPLLQGKDNQEYLHKTYDKKSSIFGSIFIDFRCDANLGDSHAIIYGHNMKNGSMFGGLKQYNKEAFYKKHKYIYVFQQEQVLKYEVVSAYKTGVTSDTYQLEFEGNKRYKDYLDMILANSFYQTGEGLSVKDKIITLSTCTGEDDFRFVVHGKLVYTFDLK